MKKICLKKLSSLTGFTLIELLVVMVIVGILLGVGIAQYISFNRRQILEQTTQGLKNNLRLAQTKAMSGEKPAGCGILDGYRVKFASNDPDNYTLVAVCEGVEVGETKNFSLPSIVKFSPLPSPILFKVLSQGTDLDSDLIISLTAFGQTKTITVSKEGKIE